jgi:hypothetical protein
MHENIYGKPSIDLRKFPALSEITIPEVQIFRLEY